MAHCWLRTLGAVQLTGSTGELLSRRRKELALLVVLVERSPRGLRREHIQALFWGDRPEQRARNSLRQALLRVRRALGEDALEIVGDEVRLKADTVASDVKVFEQLAGQGRHREAIECWTGEFMAGSDDVGGEGFFGWVNAERVRLARILAGSHAALVAEAISDGDPARELQYAAAWAAAFPLDDPAQLALIAAYCRSGRTGDALAVRTDYERRLAAELDAELGAKWWYATEDLLRQSRALEAAGAIPAADRPSSQPAAPVGSPPPAQRAWFRRRSMGIAAAVLTVVAVVSLLITSGRERTPPLLAVGHIDVGDHADTLAALPVLLTTNLARVHGVRLLSDARVRELLTQLGLSGDSASHLQRAARQAGATEIIEGVLSRRTLGRLRLDLVRIDLQTREIRKSYSVESDDVFDLLDHATEQIASGLGGQSVAVRLAGSSTSLVAYRFYEEGLRAYYGGDRDGARRLFRSAVAEDSSFGMAAYYASRVTSPPELWNYLERAARLARHMPQREGLLVQAAWAASMNEPARLLLARKLATAYPADPGAQMEYANALVQAGKFLEGAHYYQRAIELDSLGLQRNAALCVACDALPALVGAYVYADSTAAAERVAREWLRQRPDAPAAWRSLGMVQNTLGRYEDVIASNRAAARASVTPDDNGWRSDFWLRTGAFDEADRHWRRLIDTGNNDDYLTGLDHAVGSMRVQGRLTEALEAAQLYRADAPTPTEALNRGYHEAIVLFEQGQFRRAAALFDSISTVQETRSRAHYGRVRAWTLTNAATAYAAAGDTARLRALEDTVRTEGARSAYGRDQLLHHYVRGLRLRAAGDLEGAARELRASLYSPYVGNIRASYELAATLMLLRRPAEAIPVLTKALGGPIGSTGTYINRSEIVFLLGRAHALAGDSANARAQYRWVAHAWRNADAAYQLRRAQLCTEWDVCSPPNR